ncbi:MAG: pantetheine-phosphate adenylyltransferase [Rhodospirillales bacterium]|nr:pantetheine-phosphate adenylyltransferase [Rhodospirillales bacterium]
MTTPRIGVYPGTFDPLTNGHMDIISRAVHVVDRLIVGVAANTGKEPLFSLDQRVEMIREQVERMRCGDGRVVEVRPFSNLLMHFVTEMGAGIILRGLRAVSDFEYEFQMAAMNDRLNRDVETVFLMASENHQFIASRFVKEIARLGGDISTFVPAEVERKTLRQLAPELPLLAAADAGGAASPAAPRD